MTERVNTRFCLFRANRASQDQYKFVFKSKTVIENVLSCKTSRREV